MRPYLINKATPSLYLSSALLLITPFSLSTTAIAAEDLMKPVQAINFQELPPPWDSKAAPATSSVVSAPHKATIPKETRSTISRQKQQPITQTHVKKSIGNVTATSSIQSLIAAAKKNDPQAQYHLGLRYQYGNGIAMSRSKAHRWLNKAAESNHANAQYALSMFYQQFARNQQGFKKALLLLKRAADQGLVDAQYSLGMMFKNGSLVHNNPQEAKRWLKMAAAQGHIAAQLALQ